MHHSGATRPGGAGPLWSALVGCRLLPDRCRDAMGPLLQLSIRSRLGLDLDIYALTDTSDLAELVFTYGLRAKYRRPVGRFYL